MYQTLQQIKYKEVTKMYQILQQNQAQTKQKQKQETLRQILAIKKTKPNRKRVYGRMQRNVAPSLFIAKNIETVMESMSRLEIEFLKLMLSMRSQYTVVKPSHAWIAEQLDCSLTQVQNIIDRFESLGLLTAAYRHMRSSIFMFSTWLRFPDVVNRLQTYLPGIRVFALAFLHISLLLSPAGNYVRDGNLCQCIKEHDMYLNINKSALVEAYKTYGDSMGIGEKEEKKETKNLKGEERQQKYKANTYGGTGLYDRKSSQYEQDLLKHVHDRQRRKYSMQYQSDDEAQPRYDIRHDSAPAAPTYGSAPRNVAYPQYSSYAPYVHKAPQYEDPIEASNRLIEWTKTEDFRKACALLGEEVALKMCNNIVSRAIEHYEKD